MAAGSVSSPTKLNWSEQITAAGSGKPTRAIFHGVEGVGKTSMPVYSNKPIYMMTRGEQGLLTLIDNKRVPETPHFPETMTWDDALGQVEYLIETEHPYKTLVIDTLNGLERLCHEHVCNRDFNADWGKAGFTSYMQGYEVSLSDWRQLLSLFDRLRDTKNMAIICLCHTKVATFKNPEGADYDRYQPDMHAKTWSLTHKWADLVGFLNFETFVDDKKPRKATSTQNRMLFTERHAAYDAKNRLGLATEIELGGSGQEAWTNFISAVKAGKELNNNG